jgi:alpha-N-arabinofuranosidase
VAPPRNADGVVHVTLANLNPNQPVEMACELRGLAGKQITGAHLTGPTMDAHNSFDQPDEVRPVSFNGAIHTEAGITLKLPPKSVVGALRSSDPARLGPEFKGSGAHHFG